MKAVIRVIIKEKRAQPNGGPEVEYDQTIYEQTFDDISQEKIRTLVTFLNGQDSKPGTPAEKPV